MTTSHEFLVLVAAISTTGAYLAMKETEAYRRHGCFSAGVFVLISMFMIGSLLGPEQAFLFLSYSAVWTILVVIAMRFTPTFKEEGWPGLIRDALAVIAFVAIPITLAGWVNDQNADFRYCMQHAFITRNKIIACTFMMLKHRSGIGEFFLHWSVFVVPVLMLWAKGHFIDRSPAGLERATKRRQERRRDSQRRYRAQKRARQLVGRKDPDPGASG